MRKLNTSVPGIYTITHIASGKTYVGQSIHCTKRWQSHRWSLDQKKHRNRPLQHAWSLHGAEAFEFAIVAQPIDPADRLAIADMEVAVLRNYPDNYNLMEVGEPRLEASAETKAKLSAERKARWADPEYRARLSAAHKAKHADPEWSARRAASIRAAKATPEAKAKAVAHANSLWAEGGVLREQQGDVMAANWANEDYRAKQTASRKAVWEDDRVRKLRTDGIKKSWDDPDKRASRVAAITAAQRTPEARAKRSEISKAVWTPERKAKMSARRQAEEAARRAEEYSLLVSAMKKRPAE